MRGDCDPRGSSQGGTALGGGRPERLAERKSCGIMRKGTIAGGGMTGSGRGGIGAEVLLRVLLPPSASNPSEKSPEKRDF